MSPLKTVALLLLGLVAATPAWAQKPRSTTLPTAGGEITVFADRVEEIGPDDLIIASGNVEVVRGTQRVLADRVEVNRVTGDVVAEGRVIFYDGDDRLVGQRIQFNFKTGTGVIWEGRGQAAPFYRLEGERMERLGEHRYRVFEGLFTTCEGDPPAWSFRFASAVADLEDFIHGTAASFWVKGVPVVPFLPFFAAPIRRERQTGFLFPRIGNSSEKGTFVDIPFFWAISDSQDATVTLHAYTERGLGAELDYRYILSRDHAGNLGGFYVNEFLREDATPTHGDSRGWWTVRDSWLLRPGLTLRTDVNGVSDDLVLREYADRLHERSLQRVESNVFLTRSWSTWNLVGSLFWYQDLTQQRPVELHRLPELKLQGTRQPVPGIPGLLYELESSAVHFARDVGADGNRLDVRPVLARPIPFGGVVTVTPFLGGRLTGYDTTVTGTRVTPEGLAVQNTEADAQLRSLYEVGADVESRLARLYELGDVMGMDAVVHSIEPRVNYTRLDGTDLLRYRRDGTTTTNQLPQYDSIDAITEASRFNYSLTNRLRARSVAPPGTEATRWELMRFVLAHYYEALNPDQPFGPVAADLIVNPNRIFSFRGDTSYSVYGEGIQTGTTDLAVNAAPVIASIGTRYSKPDRVNFVQARLGADLARWAVARFSTDWDLREDVFVESRFALDLKWSCWALSVEYVSRHKDEDEVRFAINLLGVGGTVGTGSRISGTGPASSDGRTR
ncbi:MAG TPA: LPS assembly protein LptD [Methylomirabilota bacterium]|nr:LPS assembly protein LptD [Methylomirabilota bacterium]